MSKNRAFKFEHNQEEQAVTEWITRLNEALLSVFAEKKEANPKFSLRQFAKKSGIDASQLSRILNGDANLSARTFARIAFHLNKTPEELLVADYFYAQSTKILTVGNQQYRALQKRRTIGYVNLSEQPTSISSTTTPPYIIHEEKWI